MKSGNEGDGILILKDVLKTVTKLPIAVIDQNKDSGATVIILIIFNYFLIFFKIFFYLHVVVGNERLCLGDNKVGLDVLDEVSHGLNASLLSEINLFFLVLHNEFEASTA